ncbi:MAG: hypothetical protein JWQ96_3229 [Segetibacter sp.]|nr:hypothetical protein [Segetibacter sp.]
MQENDDNVDKVRQADTRRFQAEDNAGHIKGSRQAGNSEQEMEELRKKDEADTGDYNKLDDRGAPGGTETV